MSAEVEHPSGSGSEPKPSRFQPMPDARTTLREVLVMWAVAFGAIVVCRLFTNQAKTAATIAFLYLPIWWIDRHGLELADFGFTTARWKSDLKLLATMLLIVFPPFIFGFFGFVKLLRHVPLEWVNALTPYAGAWTSIHFRLPNPDLPESLIKLFDWIGIPAKSAVRQGIGVTLLVLDQFLVVALSEEFFYRGFIQKRLREVFPGGRVFLGVRFGGAFWLTQALFALGHLAELRPWRLAVFFPAIIFGFMREKSGTILSSTCFHALCNLTIFTLEASSFIR
jgi:membrane protease YdiL (CAAX protease family)